MIAYFGHPVSTYGTDLETRLEIAIIERFGEVENPNSPWHNQTYKLMGMKYFTEEVIPRTDLGVFLPYLDGRYGAGVAMEIDKFKELDKPVFRIDHSGKIGRMDSSDRLSIEQTRTYNELPYMQAKKH